MLPHASFPVAVGDDTKNHRSLTLQGRKIAFREHRPKVVAEEIIYVFFAPYDAAHREEIAVRVLGADRLPSVPANVVLPSAVLQKAAYFRRERQVSTSNQAQKIVKHTQPKQIDPNLLNLLGGRCRVQDLAIKNSPDVIEHRLDLPGATVTSFELQQRLTGGRALTSARRVATL